MGEKDRWWEGRGKKKMMIGKTPAQFTLFTMVFFKNHVYAWVPGMVCMYRPEDNLWNQFSPSTILNGYQGSSTGC